MADSELILDASEGRCESGVPEMDESKLLRTIWLQPRKTLLFIIYRKPNKLVTTLLVLGGAVVGLNNAMDDSGMIFNGSPYLKLAIGVFVGGIIGAVLYMVLATILAWCGRIIGGKGSYREVLPVVAWSLVPRIAQIIPVFLMLGYFGVDMVTGYVNLTTTSAQVIFYALLFIEFCLSIWSLVILVTGLSIAHRFGIGKAILNIIIPILLILIPVAIIAFIMGDLYNTI